MFKKVINNGDNNSELVSYKNQTAEAIDRIELFRTIKFITQTYKYYQKIPGIYLMEKTPKKIKRSKLFKNSIDENKLLFYKTVSRINRQIFLERDVALLYNLNRVYAEKALQIIPKIGINGHEKIATIFIAQRNYNDKIIINKQIFDLNGSQIKEFDMLAIKTEKSSNRWRGNILIEDKKTLNTECFEQIFGYHPYKELKTAHKDILKNRLLCQQNDLPAITEIEILYTALDLNLTKFKLGKMLVEKDSLELSLDKLAKLAAEFIIFNYPLRLDYNKQLEFFLEKNNTKYTYDHENNLLILAGQMTNREKKQLLNIFIKPEEKEIIKKIFADSHFSNFKELKEQTAVKNIVFTRIHINKKTLLKFFLDETQQALADTFFSRI